MRYRDKLQNETWNQYLIKIFRDSKYVRFPDFLDEYFSVQGREEAYREGILKDAVKEKKKLEKKKINKKVSESKTTFAKKPDRLKKKVKKGYLF